MSEHAEQQYIGRRIRFGDQYGKVTDANGWDFLVTFDDGLVAVVKPGEFYMVNESVVVPASGRRTPLAMNQEFLAALGTMSDAKIAEKFGTHLTTVHRFRHRLGIPSWRNMSDEYRAKLADRIRAINNDRMVKRGAK